MTVLLDGNALVALVVASHVHHDAAESWLGSETVDFATCPITQGMLARLLIRNGVQTGQVAQAITGVMANPRHTFWPDDISYTEVSMTSIIGHRQVTDAYLAQLARARGGRIATFDRGFAQQHSDVTGLIPT